MRIFIGTAEIASHYGLIAVELRRMGHKVSVYGPLLYEREPKSVNSFFIPNAIERMSLVSRRNLPKGLRFLARKFLLAILLIYVCWWSQVIIIYGGSSFISLSFDLAVLKFFRKKVIVNCGHGSESRPPYINSKYNSNLHECYKKTRLLKRRVQKIEKYADHIIGLPVLSQFFKRRLVHREIVGKPVPADFQIPRNQVMVNRSGDFAPIEICHIPSDPVSKGSETIRATISSLQELGIPKDRYNYSEYNNLSRTDVTEVLKKSDIIVTQLFSDIPTPTTALEAAAVECLPVVGGNAAGLEFGSQRIAVSLFIQPETLGEVLARLVSKPSIIIRLSERYNRNLFNGWGLADTARKYESLCLGDIPADWCFDATEYAYVWGSGLSKPEVRARVVEYHRLFGVRGFHVENNSRLESELFSLVSQGHD